MVSDPPPRLPGGTSDERYIDGPFLTLSHRLNVALIESSNISTKMTSGSFSMPASPGYRAAMPTAAALVGGSGDGSGSGGGGVGGTGDPAGAEYWMRKNGLKLVFGCSMLAKYR